MGNQEDTRLTGVIKTMQRDLAVERRKLCTWKDRRPFPSSYQDLSIFSKNGRECNAFLLKAHPEKAKWRQYSEPQPDSCMQGVGVLKIKQTKNTVH